MTIIMHVIREKYVTWDFMEKKKKKNQAVVNGSGFLDSRINEEFSVQGHSRDS